MSLYRQVRPTKFNEFLGNEATVKALKSIVKKPPDDRPHAYLFSGPSGCGKTTLARILAKEFGCSDIDLNEMDVANTRGIDTIREVIGNASLSPMGGSCRVYIFDEAHQLSKDAMNGLLKLLEDFPKNSYFMLCSTDPQKIIKTIHTRCSQFSVELLTEDEIAILLESTLANISQDVASDAVFDALVKASEGSPRRALTLLENILQVETQEDQLNLITAANIEGDVIELSRAIMKGADWNELAEIYKSIPNKDAEVIRRIILGYMKSVLLSGGRNADIASQVIEIFEKSTYDSGEASLVLMLYKSVGR
jgi:DNA polymerase-3 subunit gamma/tau